MIQGLRTCCRSLAMPMQGPVQAGQGPLTLPMPMQFRVADRGAGRKHVLYTGIRDRFFGVNGSALASSHSPSSTVEPVTAGR